MVIFPKSHWKGKKVKSKMKSVFYTQVWYKLFLNSRSISNLLLSICIQYDARTITNSNPFISTENFCTFKNILGNIKEISVVICPPRTAGTPKTIYLAFNWYSENYETFAVFKVQAKGWFTMSARVTPYKLLILKTCKDGWDTSNGIALSRSI